MKRVMIIGCGGAGKSTLAGKLGEKTGLPVVHLDKLFWKPGWVESTKVEIDQKAIAEAEKPRWIMDGNYNRTMPRRLERCDTVIYLDFSTFTCLMGVLKRVVTTYGTVRPDMAEGCPERISLKFLKWVWNFNRENRQRYHEILAQLNDKQIFILRNRREVNRFLKMLG